MNLRQHGEEQLYPSGYSYPRAGTMGTTHPHATRGIGERARGQVSQREPPQRAMCESDCYFGNMDVWRRAPADAQSLMRRLGVGSPRGPGHTAGAAAPRAASCHRRADPPV